MSPVGPVGGAAIAVGLTFVAAGILWPQTAETLLRMLVAAIALGLVLSRVVRGDLPAPMTDDSYSPFSGRGARSEQPAAPRAVLEIAESLGAADDPELARTALIPWSVERTVVDEASLRLRERHGLRLAEPAHHAAIRALVSDPTWDLLAPDASTGAPPGRGRSSVPLGRLATILDDVERL